MLVAGLEDLTEVLSPTLRGDELEMFYSSRLPPNHIEHATRTSTADPWVSRGEVTELGEMDGYVGVSTDGLAIYIEEGTAGSFRIRRSTRTSLASPWSAPMDVPSLAAANSSGDPQPTGDGALVYFASDRATQGDLDIYSATRVCP